MLITVKLPLCREKRSQAEENEQNIFALFD
jgi:hypothetical protein